MLAAKLKQKHDKKNVTLFLNLGGDKLFEIYNSFEFPTSVHNEADPSKVLNTVLAKLNVHFTKRKTMLIDRYSSTNVRSRVENQWKHSPQGSQF